PTHLGKLLCFCSVCYAGSARIANELCFTGPRTGPAGLSRGLWFPWQIVICSSKTHMSSQVRAALALFLPERAVVKQEHFVAAGAAVEFVAVSPDHDIEA